jgi:hypothetical protein
LRVLQGSESEEEVKRKPPVKRTKTKTPPKISRTRKVTEEEVVETTPKYKRTREQLEPKKTVERVESKAVERTRAIPRGGPTPKRAAAPEPLEPEPFERDEEFDVRESITNFLRSKGVEHSEVMAMMIMNKEKFGVRYSQEVEVLISSSMRGYGK